MSETFFTEKELQSYKDRIERSVLVAFDKAINHNDIEAALSRIGSAIAFAQAFKDSLVQELIQRVNQAESKLKEGGKS